MDGQRPSISPLRTRSTGQRGTGEMGERRQIPPVTPWEAWGQRIGRLSTQSNKFSINIDLDYVLL